MQTRAAIPGGKKSLQSYPWQCCLGEPVPAGFKACTCLTPLGAMFAFVPFPDAF
jgi:hypothetical protein